MVNKNTVDYYPNPYHLVSRMHTLIFLYIPEGFISAEYFLGFFPKPAYSTLVAKKFQIYSTKITANIFVSQKIESVYFYSWPEAKLSFRFLSLSSKQMGSTHSSQIVFFKDTFCWGENGKRINELEKIPKLTQSLDTSIGHKFG